MSWINRLFGQKQETSGGPQARRVTVRDPLVISSPTIGYFNLLGTQADGILTEDKTALGPLFSRSESSDQDPPVCDVLMLYARIEPDGRIAGSVRGLREITRDARAAIVVVASENGGNAYIAGAKKTGYGQANLVLTLARRGPVFDKFFAALFSQMFQGTTMPLAWVNLAPQIPGKVHENCPDTIFVAEISHIAFK